MTNIKKRNIKERKTEKITREHLAKTKSFVPGRLYTFDYDAKWKGRLPIWDKQPLILVLDNNPVRKTGKSYILGLNLHYPFNASGLTLKMLFSRILKMYTDYQEKIITRQDLTQEVIYKKFINLNYGQVLVSPEVLKLKLGIRLYLRNRIRSPKFVQIKYYNKVGTRKMTNILRAKWARY